MLFLQICELVETRYDIAMWRQRSVPDIFQALCTFENHFKIDVSLILVKGKGVPIYLNDFGQFQ